MCYDVLNQGKQQLDALLACFTGIDDGEVVDVFEVVAIVPSVQQTDNLVLLLGRCADGQVATTVSLVDLR